MFRLLVVAHGELPCLLNVRLGANFCYSSYPMSFHYDTNTSYDLMGVSIREGDGLGVVGLEGGCTSMYTARTVVSHIVNSVWSRWVTL